jgi:hypothetical protein
VVFTQQTKGGVQVSRDWALIQEYEEAIIDRLTPEELIAVLGITIQELVDILWDSHIEGNAELRDYVYS